MKRDMPERWKGDVAKELARLPVTQAERVLHKFGGVRRLHRLFLAMNEPISKSALYRWSRGFTTSTDGCGGLIPVKHWPAIFRAARLEGIILTSEDIDPRVQFMDRATRRYYPRRIYKTKGLDE